MERAFLAGLLLAMSAGVVNAQETSSGGTTFRLGAGLTSSDFTCSGCEITALTGFSGFVAGSKPLGRLLAGGLEATVSRASNEPVDVTLLSALATAGVHGGRRTPLWATLGLGWLWYSGTGPNSNGPAVSLRAGADFPVGSRLALTPYAGYLSMIGHDGPRAVVGAVTSPTDPGVATRVASLQLGLGVTLTP